MGTMTNDLKQYCKYQRGGMTPEKQKIEGEISEQEEIIAEKKEKQLVIKGKILEYGSKECHASGGLRTTITDYLEILDNTDLNFDTRQMLLIVLVQDLAKYFDVPYGSLTAGGSSVSNCQIDHTSILLDHARMLHGLNSAKMSSTILDAPEVSCARLENIGIIAIDESTAVSQLLESEQPFFGFNPYFYKNNYAKVDRINPKLPKARTSKPLPRITQRRG